MNSSFPLYDNLIMDLNNTSVDLKTKEKDEFMSLIKKIDDNTSELVYALIRVYQLENNENISTFTLPYDGKFIDNEIKFDLNELPNKLKHILLKFLKMHCSIKK